MSLPSPAPHRLRWATLASTAAALMTAVLLAACGPEPRVAYALVAAGTTTFTPVAGDTTPLELRVRIETRDGRAVRNAEVRFSTGSGDNGTLSAQRDTTDRDGYATTTWRPGTRAIPQQVLATAELLISDVVEFVARVRPAAPAVMAIAGGNQQSAVVGTPTLVAPSVVVRDRFANAVPGVPVIFSVATGGGSLATTAMTNTNDDGMASPGAWRLGTVTGVNTLTALAPIGGITGNPVTFTATATAAAPATVTAVSATTLAGPVARAVTPAPQVRVTDANGNAVANAAVTFTTSGGATLAVGTTTGATVTRPTDASGLVTVDSWTLGTAAGSYTVAAAVPGLPAVTFSAAARADVPAALTISAGNNQSAPVGRAVPVEPAVRVADTHGNPVAGVEVFFEVASGGGSAVGRRATTSASGIATVGGWTLGDLVGPNTLSATLTGTATVPAVTFTATGTAGAAATMAAAAGQNQTATAGALVAVAPAVIVRDARGNPVANTAVTFTVAAGAGTVTGGTATTNASGVATVGSWRLGGGAGTQTLVARSGSLPEVTFIATASAGAAARLSAFGAQSQSGVVAGITLPASQRPAVRVTDAEGNPVAGVTVTFRVAADSTSGTLAGDTVATAVTNTNGIATLSGWRLPTLAGVVATATASANGIAETVPFTVTTTFGPVARFRLLHNGGSTMATTAGSSGTNVTVTALDANNNTVTSYSGLKALVFGGAGLAPAGTAPTVNGTAMGTATAVTFANGQVTVVLRVFRVEVASIVANDATTTGGIPLVVTVNAGAESATTSSVAAAATVARGDSTAVTVTFRDAHGNLTAGAANLFTATRTTVSGSAGLLSNSWSCSGSTCTAFLFTSSQAAGENRIAVTMSGIPIVGSPVTITNP